MTLDDLIRESETTNVVQLPKPPPRDRGDITVTLPAGWTVEYKHGRHMYFLDGDKVASVSGITGCLDKPALKWWGMQTGVAGMIELARRDVVPGEAFRYAERDSLVALLTQEKLTVNHVMRDAADRGSRVHDSMEDWALSGVLPDPEGLPEDEQGYIHGLRLFIEEVQPEPATEAVEAIVASKAWRFAGRCDLLRCVIPKPVIACVGIERKTRKETRTIIPAGVYLIDLKTTSGVFKEAHFQVSGYEGASVECGYPPTDHQAILRVTVDGRYELVETRATFSDFLNVLGAFSAVKRIEAA